jgi:hypothetical protein
MKDIFLKSLLVGGSIIVLIIGLCIFFNKSKSPILILNADKAPRAVGLNPEDPDKFGYKERKCCFNELDYSSIKVFTDSALKQISIKELYENGLNDKAYVLNYKQNLRIFFWEIGQYKRMLLSDAFDSITFYDVKQVTWYQSYGPEDYVDFHSKLFLPENKTVVINLYRCGNVRRIANDSSSQYFTLDLNAINLITDKDGYDLEFHIGAPNFLFPANLMVKRFDDKFYLIVLYSPERKKIMPTELKEIMKS